MRIRYDAQVDALYIRLREGKIRDSDEIEPGLIADYGEDGKVMGIEVLDASEFLGGKEMKVELALTPKD
ncbi:MAG TPA: DUF2283 domain-containing protein [Dehalococcoidia bacterium]|jgi:uncharacterized protein YuzE